MNKIQTSQELLLKDKLVAVNEMINAYKQKNLKPFSITYKEKEKGSGKYTPITYIKKDKSGQILKDKNGKEMKGYIASFQFITSLSETEKNKLIVNVFSNYILKPEQINIATEQLLKGFFEKMKEDKKLKLEQVEYQKDNQTIKLNRYSVNVGYNDFDWTLYNQQKQEAKQLQTEDKDNSIE